MANLSRAQSLVLETQKKELNMVAVLVCIVVLFIFCQSFKIVPDIYEAVTCHTFKIEEVGLFFHYCS